MSPLVETLVQTIGVVAGVAGAVFAFQQYRLARRGQASPLDTQEESGEGAQGFVCVHYPDIGNRALSILFLGSGAYAILSAQDPTGGMIVGAVLLTTGALMVDHLWHRSSGLVLDSQYLRLNWATRHRRRIAWAYIDHMAIVGVAGRRKLVAVLNEGQGFVAGFPAEYLEHERGYVVCELKEVKPSEADLLAALKARTGSDVEVKEAAPD